MKFDFKYEIKVFDGVVLTPQWTLRVREKNFAKIKKKKFF